MDRDYFGIVYCLTNIINNKKYIGQTKHTIEYRIKDHFANRKNPTIPLHKAIKKYGKDKFDYEILCYCYSRNELNNKEKEFIKKYTENGFILYNCLLESNSTYEYSKNHLKNLSDRAKNLWKSKEYRKKIKETKIKNNTYERLSKEHSLFMKEMWKDDNYRNHMINAHKGRKHTEEQKKKMSEIMKSKGYDHIKNMIEIGAMYKKGKPRSEETKRKISESLKRRYKKLTINDDSDTKDTDSII